MAFRASGATIGSDADCVGEDVARFEINRLDIIIAGRHQAGQVRDIVEGRVDTELGDHMQAQAPYSSLVIKGDRGVRYLGTSLCRGQEMFHTCASPLERHIAQLRQLRYHDFFGCKARFLRRSHHRHWVL